MNFLIYFTIITLLNVVLSTVKSIITIKGSKTVASVVSGLYYGFYNLVLIYTVSDFPMWQKCVITFVCNLVGVYAVKSLEEKARKDRLWKVETTVSTLECSSVCAELKQANLSYNYIEGVGKYNIVNIFCETQAESAKAKKILSNYQVKYFVSESKNL